MYLHCHVHMWHLQEQLEKQKREINQLKLKLRNRQKDENVINRLLHEKSELERKYAIAVKTERTTCQHIKEVGQENETLKTRVEDIRESSQVKHVS